MRIVYGISSIYEINIQGVLDVETIVRITKRENPFVMIDKEFLNNTCLSWKAKGLLAYFLSKPDDWKIVVKDIINHGPDGRDSVYAGIKELEKCGYIKKTILRSKETNKFIGIEYIVYEKPQISQQDSDSSASGFSVSGKSDTTNNDITNNNITNNNNIKVLSNLKDTSSSKNVVVDNFKKNDEIAAVRDDNDDEHELENLFSKVTGRRNDKFVSMLRGKFDSKDIKSKLEFFGEYIKTHEVKSPEGFIFDALRRDYEPNLPVVKKNKVKCKRCDGDGYFVDKNTGEVCFCPDCGGKGLILPESEYT
ncbi:MAG: hypothetical protein PWQ60_2392 [Thermoanaerobacteraceae bacterium]|nr:hypothetical protein [Thermoanaerobacteraceae bacterium]